VNLGFVSAYVLVRGGEAVVVDTGVAGSADEIETALGDIGLGWPDVGHVVLTHKHSDHAGSAEAVLAAASGAKGYAGAADLASITAPRSLMAVADGATVAGLRIVATPGHTLGHVSVLDEANGILVAGDALGTVGGTLAGSNPQFTEDAAAAKATVIKLGDLRFETLLVGHGDPIEGGASAQVKALGQA
jgi:glyoxylase-like metal-dependent hydrolase (beta-lactamase superfamily II)